MRKRWWRFWEHVEFVKFQKPDRPWDKPRPLEGWFTQAPPGPWKSDPSDRWLLAAAALMGLVAIGLIAFGLYETEKKRAVQVVRDGGQP